MRGSVHLLGASKKIRDLPSWGYRGDDSVEVDWGMSAVTWGPSEVTQTPPLIWLYGGMSVLRLEA